MRRWLAGAGACLALCGGVVVRAFADSSPSPAQALADLNAMRTAAGERAVASMSGDFSAGCAAHNAYMAQNGRVLSHTETQGDAGYTVNGAVAGANSLLATGQVLPSHAWSDTLYHRLAMLAPRLSVSGYDASSGFTCMRTILPAATQASALPSLHLYPWPTPHATGVPTRFRNNEAPDPHADAPGAHTLGYILTVSVDGPWPACQALLVRVKHASLRGRHKKTVPLSVADARSPNAVVLASGFGLLPRRALAPHTAYTASATGTIATVARTYTCPEPQGFDYSKLRAATYPFSISWSFTTGRS